MKKHLVITDEVDLCMKLIEGYEGKLDLLEALTGFINGKIPDTKNMFIPTKDAFIYLTANERKDNLIHEEEKINDKRKRNSATEMD